MKWTSELILSPQKDLHLTEYNLEIGNMRGEYRKYRTTTNNADTPESREVNEFKCKLEIEIIPIGTWHRVVDGPEVVNQKLPVSSMKIHFR